MAVPGDRSHRPQGPPGPAGTRYRYDGEGTVLDARGDGAFLVGVARPTLPDSDEEPLYDVRLVRGGAAVSEALADSVGSEPVRFARFVADAVVTISREHDLRVHRADGVGTLDALAQGPVAVAGTTVLYTRGEAPFVELARADIASGMHEVLTTEMAPVWNPAISPDGRTIVFVSSAAGTPRLYRIRDGAAVEPLAPAERIPDAPRAPRLEGDVLVFDDGLGTVWFDTVQGRIVRTAPAATGNEPAR